MVDQYSALRVKLSDLLEGMDFQSDERSSFLNLTTGEVVSITDEELRAAENDEPLEDFPAWQHDAIHIAREILETAHYLPLTTTFDIHECGTDIVMQPGERLPWRGVRTMAFRTLRRSGASAREQWR